MKKTFATLLSIIIFALFLGILGTSLNSDGKLVDIVWDALNRLAVWFETAMNGW